MKRIIYLILFVLIFLNVKLFAQKGTMVTFIANVDNYHADGYNDCWGYTAPDGREYALLGVQSGTSIIDITDTSNISEIAFIGSANSIWKDIKTYQHYAYVVTENGGGMQIIDLSNLPASANIAATYTGFQTSHNLWIDSTNAMLYAEGSFSEPVRALSLADPLNPVELSTFGIECHDMYARDNICYVAEGNSGSIGVYDLNDPANPTLIRRHYVPNAGYVHNVWLSDDGNFLISTEETSGKSIKYWDISNPIIWTIRSEYLGPDGLAHNAHIKGQYAYVSHYGDGLEILDLSDPDNMSRYANYDTWPGTGGGYDGAWGAYPFFESGKQLISDISTGLYIVQFQPAVTGLADDKPTQPGGFALRQNYPNPFNPVTTISYSMPQTAGVELSIYNVVGQKVRDFSQRQVSAGEHNVVWDGKNDSGELQPSGVYFYRITVSGESKFQQVKSMVLMK